jgi:archaellum component FlaC
MAERPTDIRVLAGELVKRMNEDSRRIRLLEQRNEKIESGFNSLQETILIQMDGLKVKLERIAENINSVSNRLTAIENEIQRLNKELGKTASKAELKQLEAFIELINPITSKFITRDEMERILDERLRKKT